MGEAVSHAIRGIGTGINGKCALQLVMAGSVQEIADRDYARHSSSKKDQLARSSAFTKRFSSRIQFSASFAQVVVSDAKVERLQCCVGGKQGFVGSVPKRGLRRELRQILRAASAAYRDRDQK